MYSKVKENQVPKRERYQPSRFEATPEWAAMKADLDKGLKPKETAKLELTEGDYARIGVSSKKTIYRFLLKYVKDNGLPYKVKSRQSQGRDFILISCASSNIRAKKRATGSSNKP